MIRTALQGNRTL